MFRRHVLTNLRRNGNSILVDGYNLSVPAVAAAARYNAPVVLDDTPGVRERLQQSRDVIVSKMEAGKSVYGVSTGYGGSGEYRPPVLNNALLHAADILASLQRIPGLMTLCAWVVPSYNTNTLA